MTSEDVRLGIVNTTTSIPRSIRVENRQVTGMKCWQGTSTDFTAGMMAALQMIAVWDARENVKKVYQVNMVYVCPEETTNPVSHGSLPVSASPTWPRADPCFQR